MNTDRDSCQRQNKSLLREVTLDPGAVGLSETLQTLPTELLTESYRRLQLLYELSRNICAETDVESVYTSVIDALHQLFAVKRCFLATVDSNQRLQARSCRGIELATDIAKWPISKTIVHRVYEGGLALLIPNALSEFPGAPSVGRHSIRSVICAPLGPPDCRIGVIYADNTMEADQFSELDLSFLSLISHYAFLAVQNATRLEQARSDQQCSAERCAALQSELLREHRIIGSSQPLLKAFELLKRAAASNLRILLLGESGIGKELFARAAHRLSKRSDECFVPVHIAGLPEELIESELFGHEAEAFTGATRRKIGKFETAQNGTLFLDEVAEIPFHVQAKLLRVLESQQIERVGGNKPIHVDFRLLCATNKNLELEVKEGRFREDLYFRINGVSITLPPLRERLDDIPVLSHHFLKSLGVKKRFGESAMKLLRDSPWPGNIRQLAHVIERTVVMSEESEISAEELQMWLDEKQPDTRSGFSTLGEVVATAERKHIRHALRLTQGNKERASKILGIAKGTLYGKLGKYGLDELPED